MFIIATNHQITKVTLSHSLLSSTPTTEKSFPKERLLMRQEHVATGGPQRNKVWGYLWAGTGERCLNQTLSSVNHCGPRIGDALCSQQKSNYREQVLFSMFIQQLRTGSLFCFYYFQQQANLDQICCPTTRKSLHLNSPTRQVPQEPTRRTRNFSLMKLCQSYN